MNDVYGSHHSSRHGHRDFWDGNRDVPSWDGGGADSSQECSRTKDIETLWNQAPVSSPETQSIKEQGLEIGDPILGLQLRCCKTLY